MRRYAVRRVNPFRGVMQVIDSEEGRALSCNGIVWEILVRASHASAIDDSKKTYYRFGMWSGKYGLMKRANSPNADEDYFSLMSKCETLIEYVKGHYDQLPFTLEDSLELWLFCPDQKPLALLHSCLPDAELPLSEPEHWFACLGENGSPSQRRFPQAKALESQVAERAGVSIDKRWVKRQAEGQGVIENSNIVIPANQFPALLLDEDWLDEEEKLRVEAYIKWISPSLLTLQHLDEETRERVENNLHVQAISIEHHWHLYPEVINRKLLKAARVQNKIEANS